MSYTINPIAEGSSFPARLGQHVDGQQTGQEVFSTAEHSFFFPAKEISILPYFTVSVIFDLWAIVPRVSSFSTTFV